MLLFIFAIIAFFTLSFFLLQLCYVNISGTPEIGAIQKQIQFLFSVFDFLTTKLTVKLQSFMNSSLMKF